jgi:hypothetical protein
MSDPTVAAVFDNSSSGRRHLGDPRFFGGRRGREGTPLSIRQCRRTTEAADRESLLVARPGARSPTKGFPMPRWVGKRCRAKGKRALARRSGRRCAIGCPVAAEAATPAARVQSPGQSFANIEVARDAVPEGTRVDENVKFALCRASQVQFDAFDLRAVDFNRSETAWERANEIEWGRFKQSVSGKRGTTLEKGRQGRRSGRHPPRPAIPGSPEERPWSRSWPRLVDIVEHDKASPAHHPRRA